MNNFKKIAIAAILIAVAMIETDALAKRGATQVMQQGEELVDVDEAIDFETAQVNQMTLEAEEIKDAAATAINNARRQLQQGEISRAQAAAIIGEQNYNIQQANARLAHAVEESVEKVQEAEAQEGYLSRLVSGVKSWYYGPGEERAVAQAILDELQKEFMMVEKEYALKMQAADQQAGMRYTEEWNTIKQDFENEIAKQQQIINGRLSSKKFWGAIGLAGAAIGGAIAYKYLGSEATPLANEALLSEARLNELMEQQEKLQQLQVENELLDTAMARQRELEALAEAPSPTLRQRMDKSLGYVRGKVGSVAQRARDITQSGRERLAKFREQGMRPATEQAAEQARLRERRAQTRAEAAPVVSVPEKSTTETTSEEPSTATTEEVPTKTDAILSQKSYVNAKKQFDAAMIKYREAQQKIAENEAKIRQLQSQPRSANTVTQIRNLENKRSGLSKALSRAETTLSNKQTALTFSKKKLHW